MAQHRTIDSGDRKARKRKLPANSEAGNGWALELAKSSANLVCLCHSGKIAFLNDAGKQMLGIKRGTKFIGLPLVKFVHTDDIAVAQKLLKRKVPASKPLALRLASREGHEIEVEAFSASRGMGDGEVVIQARDLTARMSTGKLTREAADRRRAEGSLRLAAKVIETTNEAVLIADAKFRVTSVNPAFTEITGYQSDEVIGKKPTFHKALRKDKTLFAKMQEDMEKQGHWQGEFWNKRKNGEDYAQRLSISAITDETGKVQQYAALIGDITKRKQDEERIRYQANYDSLTELPNRTLFLDRLNFDLARMKRGQGKLGLMFIDLDGFKLVNDTLGHEVGDLLLQEAARRLSKCVRRGDTIARLGGDEFTVIMPDLEDPRNGSMVAQRILDALAKPYVLDGHEAFVSASIGITVFPDDGDSASHLLRNADAAMYRAKDQGKANYQFFTVDLNEAVKERVVLKNSLIKARQGDEFTLHYQPKLAIGSGQVTSVEALMRWNSRKLGAISPAKFIPIMEESGMAMEMGEWVIRTACAQFRKWRKKELEHFLTI